MGNDLFTFPTRKTPLMDFAVPYNMSVNLGSEIAAMHHAPLWTSGNKSTADAMDEAAAAAYTPDQLDRLAITEEEQDWAQRLTKARTSDELDALMIERATFDARRKTIQQELEAESIAEGRLMTPEALEEKYGGIGLEFDRPMADGEANILYARKRREIILDEMSARSKGGFLRGAAKLGFAFVRTAVDPTEIAISVGATAIMPLAGASRLARFGAAAAESFVASVASEAVFARTAQRLQLDYDMNDALLNVGLGTLLGGGIGMFIAPRARVQGLEGAHGMIRTKFVRSQRDTELGEIALRQFINDEPIDFAPMRTDLRSTTSLVSVRGVAFQSRILDTSLPSVPRPSTALVMTEANMPYRAETREVAERFASRSGGGTVVELPSGAFGVRQPIEGGFVTNRRGEAIMLDTRQAATEFIEGARKAGVIPDNSVPLPIYRPGGVSYAVATDMPVATVRNLETGRADLNIPKSASSDEIALRPDRLDDAVQRTVRGNAAYETVGRQYAAKPRAAVGSTVIEDTIGEGAEDLAAEAEVYKGMLTQIPHDIVKNIDKEATAREDGTKAAVKCLLENTV